ncbi:unnamed protein product [Callosobruchus maculatus]|uniref:Uncharacterized protein n=1 Tax=Callosobruchus maculatus TaxID=64391 RepID=A0A653DW73_CALMS|nr:unnamed protein product [Callosobruchus maculatus]
MYDSVHDFLTPTYGKNCTLSYYKIKKHHNLVTKSRSKEHE